MHSCHSSLPHAILLPIISDYRRLMDLSKPLQLSVKDLEKVFRYLACDSGASSIEKLKITSKSWTESLKKLRVRPEDHEAINAAYPLKRKCVPCVAIEYLKVSRDEIDAMIHWSTKGKSRSLNWTDFSGLLRSIAT